MFTNKEYWHTVHTYNPNVALHSCSSCSVVARHWSRSLWPTLAGGILGRSLDVTRRGSFSTLRTDEELSWWGRARLLKVREQTFASLQRLQSLSWTIIKNIIKCFFFFLTLKLSSSSVRPAQSGISLFDQQAFGRRIFVFSGWWHVQNVDQHDSSKMYCNCV